MKSQQRFFSRTLVQTFFTGYFVLASNPEKYQSLGHTELLPLF